MAVKNCTENTTVIMQFVILGFLTRRALDPLLLLIFSNIYLFSIAGNSMILITVSMHRRLHSLMYLFLGNLSFLEFWYILTFMPTILGGLLPEGRTISFTSCIMRCFFAGFLLCTECCLLLVMAYDRYLAICFPFHNTTVMDQQFCLQLAGSSWLSGFIIALFVIFPIQQLHFSKLNMIDHFFCDLGPLIQAACSDTSVVEIDIFVVSIFALLIPFPVIIVSYTFIISAIMKIPSAIGREKAFSTCSSHLLVVGIYFGSLITTYSMPKTGSSPCVGKVSLLLYTTGECSKKNLTQEYNMVCPLY